MLVRGRELLTLDQRKYIDEYALDYIDALKVTQ